MAKESLKEAEIPPEVRRLASSASRVVDGRTEGLIRRYNLARSLELAPKETNIFFQALAKRVAKDYFLTLADERGLKLSARRVPGAVPTGMKTDEEKLAERLLVGTIDLLQKLVAIEYAEELGVAADDEALLNLVRKIDFSANLISAIIFRQEENTEQQVQIAIGRFRYEITKARDRLYQTEPDSSRP